MRVTVFGANGRVGSLVVELLVKAGHEVRAFVHGEPRTKLAEVTYIQGDVADSAAVKSALEHTDAVVSALGSWGTVNKDTLRVAMNHIVPVMQASGIQRIVSLTGADAWTPDQYEYMRSGWRAIFGSIGGRPAILQLASHTAFSVIAKKIIQDGELHIKVLAESSLDWTVVRSPVMNTRGDGHYHLSNKYPMPWQTIHRHAVARALVDQLLEVNRVPGAPFITRR
jgi:hypothetical protein